MAYRIHFHAVSVSAALAHLDGEVHAHLPGHVLDTVKTMLHGTDHPGPVEVVVADDDLGKHELSVQHITMVGEAPTLTGDAQRADDPAAETTRGRTKK